MGGKLNELTEKQRRYVEAFMGEAAGNGTQAARLAGYKGSDHVLAVTSSQLQAKAHIKAALKVREESDPLKRDRTWAQTRLRDIADGKAFDVLVKGKKHKVVATLDLRAECVKTLMKTWGMFVQRVEVTTTGSVIVELPDNQRADRIPVPGGKKP